MVSKDKALIVLGRDVYGQLVPSGARIMLHEDTQVKLTQSLGGSFTVEVYGNLVRIEGKDADALGKTACNPFESLPKDAPLDDKINAQLAAIYDPEIPVNILELGLIYNIKTTKEKENLTVQVTMTLTAPGCGMGPVITGEVETNLLMIPEIDAVTVELVFDPPWDRDRMSEAARLQLGMF